MSALRIWTRFDFRPRTRWRFVLLPFLLATLRRAFTVNWKGENFTYTLPAEKLVTFTWK